MAVLATKFGYPTSLPISSIGIGIGSKTFDRPNILRIFKLCTINENDERSNPEAKWEELIFHEAWIDDATPEDIAALCNQLRSIGAIEVVYNPVQMKKNRQGFLVASISTQENLLNVRNIWFSFSTTIGLRERIGGRWVLPRRNGYCLTSLGKIRVKQVLRPNGKVTFKPEHDDLIRVSQESGKTLDQIRSLLYLSDTTFLTNDDDWL